MSMKHISIFLALTLSSVLLAEQKPIMDKVAGSANTYTYNQQEHERRINELFKKHIPEIIKFEKSKIESIAPKLSDKYIEFFRRGLESNTGMILIDGSNRKSLEIAFRAGYEYKSTFHKGYFSGLTKEAEDK